MDPVQRVEADPDHHDAHLDEDEDPAADQAREVVGDAHGESDATFNLAVEISHRRMVVLVLDQVSGDVFDFSGDRHGSFLWVAAMNSGCNGIAWGKRPVLGYGK